MKILYVSQSFYPSTGGVSYYLFWLGRRLRQLGHTVVFINLKTPKGSSDTAIEGMSVYRVPKDGSIDGATMAGYSTYKELILKIFHGKESALDKLYNKHLYGYEGYIKVNEIFAERIREVADISKPDIIHVHDFQLLPLGGILKRLGLPMPFTWHIPFTEEVHQSWREQIVKELNEYSKVVFSTKPYINAALKSGLVWKKPCCIPPFIDVEEPKRSFRKSYGISKNAKIILCVARIDKLKGQSVLLDAASRMKSDYKIIFIGNGSVTKEFLKIKEKEDYEKELKEKVDEYNLKDRVLFTGAIDRDSLMSAYKECDLVVLPSHQEGFGLAITEGMAFGRPVIGSAVGGIPTQIWPGVNGYIVKPNDATALAEAIDYVLTNFGRAREMGDNGKKIYQTNFSTERGVQDHLALYRELLT